MDITYCMTKDCPLKHECLRHENNHDMRGQIYSISDFGCTYGDPKECKQFIELGVDRPMKKCYDNTCKKAMASKEAMQKLKERL